MEVVPTNAGRTYAPGLRTLFLATLKRRKAAHSKGFARFVASNIAKRLECGAFHRFSLRPTSTAERKTSFGRNQNVWSPVLTEKSTLPAEDGHTPGLSLAAARLANLPAPRRIKTLVGTH